jgi:hypothetical protein
MELGKTGFTRAPLGATRVRFEHPALAGYGQVTGFLRFCIQNTSVHPLGNPPG